MPPPRKRAASASAVAKAKKSSPATEEEDLQGRLVRLAADFAAQKEALEAAGAKEAQRHAAERAEEDERRQREDERRRREAQEGQKARERKAAALARVYERECAKVREEAAALRAEKGGSRGLCRLTTCIDSQCAPHGGCDGGGLCARHSDFGERLCAGCNAKMCEACAGYVCSCTMDLCNSCRKNPDATPSKGKLVQCRSSDCDALIHETCAKSDYQWCKGGDHGWCEDCADDVTTCSCEFCSICADDGDSCCKAHRMGYCGCDSAQRGDDW